MTTTKATRYFETLISDLEDRAEFEARANRDAERQRLLKAAAYYRARQPSGEMNRA